MSKKGRVLVAMSGGVDSSVAAVMLHEQGYEVIGITMKTWDYHRSGGNNGKETGCCTVESMNDARQIAVRFGFKHFIVDIRDEFGNWVIDRFVEDYTSGRTPIRAYYATRTLSGQPCSEGQMTWGVTILQPATMRMFVRKMAVTSSPRGGITTKTSRMHSGV